MLVAREDPDDASSQLHGEPAEIPHGVDLHLPLRDLRVLRVRGEVGVGRQALKADAAILHLGLEPAARLGVHVEKRCVGALRSQHDAIEAERSRPLDGLLQGELRLTPRARIADRVEGRLQWIVPFDATDPRDLDILQFRESEGKGGFRQGGVDGVPPRDDDRPIPSFLEKMIPS